MQTLTPNLAVNSIVETIEYYQRNFGFELQMLVDDSKTEFDTQIDKKKSYIWAMMQCGAVSLMFQDKESLKDDVGSFFEDIASSLSLYIMVDDVDSFYESTKEKVEIYKDIETTWYGQREFYVKDINGYILGFASLNKE